MLPGLRSEEDSGWTSRLAAAPAHKAAESRHGNALQYGYYRPKFTDNCFGWWSVRKSLPRQRFGFEEMPNGQTRMVLTRGSVQRVRRVHGRVLQQGL